jgi:hypothetical protein
MPNLQEGRSILRVRPRIENTLEWLDVIEFTIFVDTLPPTVISPQIVVNYVDDEVTVSASSISDDISLTTDVSGLDYVRFRANVDGGLFSEEEYTLSGEISSPTLSHTFSFSDLHQNDLFGWEVSAADLSGNVIISSGTSLSSLIDTQIHVRGIAPSIHVSDGMIFIKGLGKDIVIKTTALDGIIDTATMGGVIRTSQVSNILEHIDKVNTDCL